MKKVVIWLALFAASVGLMVLLFGKNCFVPLSVLFMIGLHEYGHLGAAKYLGVKTKGFYFIPGLGGVALLEGFPQKRWHDFWIAYAGPLVGFASTLVLMMVNYWLQLPVLWQAASWWAAINLLNLFAILPLDGGKIAWSICSDSTENWLSSYYGLLLSALSAFLIYVFGGLFITAFIVWIGFMERNVMRLDNERKQLSGRGKIPMTQQQSIVAFALYLLLFISLIPLIWISVS